MHRIKLICILLALTGCRSGSNGDKAVDVLPGPSDPGLRPTSTTGCELQPSSWDQAIKKTDNVASLAEVLLKGDGEDAKRIMDKARDAKLSCK